MKCYRYACRLSAVRFVLTRDGVPWTAGFCDEHATDYLEADLIAVRKEISIEEAFVWGVQES